MFGLDIAHLVFFLSVVAYHLEPKGVALFSFAHPVVSVDEKVVAAALHDEVGV